MDAGEIKRALASRAIEVAKHLLPNGEREGQEWCAGSVAGEKGRSLKVQLTGPRAGLWSDFASQEGGDLIDLWCSTRRITFTESLDEIRSWLGVERPQVHRPAPKSYVRPPKPSCLPPQNRVRDYLTEVRNIPAEIIARFKIGEAGDEIVFPFLLPDGTLAMAKKRKAEDGAKPKPTAADCEPVLFGWQAMPDGAREVVLTEGEIDALSWAAYGYPSLSVPYGGGGGAKQQWIESEFERMERFERIYLALDMDEPGEMAAQTIADRLGRHRCYRVTMPRKDGNECLVDGVPQAEIAAAVKAAKTYDPDGIALPSSFADQVDALFWPKPGQHVGYQTPYANLGTKLLFRPAELTIWSGGSGSGKSQILSDCTVDWVQQGSRVCLSSLEMAPAQTLKRMMKQTIGTDRPTREAIDVALRWLDQGLVLYTLTGSAKVDALLEVFDYCRSKYGCDQFIIDSLMRLGIAGDDLDAQNDVIQRLVSWAMQHAVHVHLVAHARKGDKKHAAPPDGDDVYGAMQLVANAANVITIWRNRKLEDAIYKAAKAKEQAAGPEPVDVSGDDASGKPPVILNVVKQRNGTFERAIGLWFNEDNFQYASSQDNRRFPRRYLPVGSVIDAGRAFQQSTAEGL